MTDDRYVVETSQPSRGVSTGGMVGMALAATAAAGALTWLASRNAQGEIDARTRRRLMPLSKETAR